MRTKSGDEGLEIFPRAERSEVKYVQSIRGEPA